MISLQLIFELVSVVTDFVEVWHWVFLHVLEGMKNIFLAHIDCLFQYLIICLIVFICTGWYDIGITHDVEFSREANLLICIDRELQMLLVDPRNLPPRLDLDAFANGSITLYSFYVIFVILPFIWLFIVPLNTCKPCLNQSIRGLNENFQIWIGQSEVSIQGVLLHIWILTPCSFLNHSKCALLQLIVDLLLHLWDKECRCLWIFTCVEVSTLTISYARGGVSLWWLATLDLFDGVLWCRLVINKRLLRQDQSFILLFKLVWDRCLLSVALKTIMVIMTQLIIILCLKIESDRLGIAVEEWNLLELFKLLPLDCGIVLLRGLLQDGLLLLEVFLSMQARVGDLKCPRIERCTWLSTVPWWWRVSWTSLAFVSITLLSTRFLRG